jgi:hypothetical protein
MDPAMIDVLHSYSGIETSGVVVDEGPKEEEWLCSSHHNLLRAPSFVGVFWVK